jgi:hypothetical protein
MKRLTTTLLGTALAAALFIGAPTSMLAKSSTSKAKKHKKSKKNAGSASRMRTQSHGTGTMSHPSSSGQPQRTK